MPGGPPDQPPRVEEIDEGIYLIKCLMTRVAALTPITRQFRQAGPAGASLNRGGDVLRALRDMKQMMRQERTWREARAKAQVSAEVVRLVVPLPERVTEG